MCSEGLGPPNGGEDKERSYWLCMELVHLVLEYSNMGTNSTQPVTLTVPVLMEGLFQSRI
jgi:hypothetical protein